MSSEHDDLPLPDFDHLPIGGLRTRIRALDAGALDTLIAYEKEHANRLPALTLLRSRRDELAAGATPTEGDPAAARPEAPAAAPVPPAVSEATSGPPLNPPSQGVPSNPAQPR